MRIRDATEADWPAMWSYMRGIVAEGETFSWDLDIDEQDARGYWLSERRGHTFVAVDETDVPLGATRMEPNRGGGGAHVASAGFMVDRGARGRGIGRMLGERVIEQARADGYRAIQFNAVVASNTAAVALWTSLGFQILATVPDGFRRPSGEYVGLHVMYLSL
ncbi:MAG TPA: GNAT family N-acetyltransferase [Solirubrobacteraceae bacterium]|jgi:L-amino acid N-acyltransferase YncA